MQGDNSLRSSSSLSPKALSHTVQVNIAHWQAWLQERLVRHQWLILRQKGTIDAGVG